MKIEHKILKRDEKNTFCISFSDRNCNRFFREQLKIGQMNTRFGMKNLDVVPNLRMTFWTFAHFHSKNKFIRIFFVHIDVRLCIDIELWRYLGPAWLIAIFERRMQIFPRLLWRIFVADARCQWRMIWASNVVMLKCMIRRNVLPTTPSVSV